MALKTDTRQFGDLSVTVTQLPVRRSAKLLRRLTAALAPALGEAAGPALKTVKNDGMAGLMKMDLSALGGAFERLFRQLDDEALDSIVFDPQCGALATAKVVGPKGSTDLLPVVDNVLGGNVILLGQIVAFALGVHFADFFAALAASAETSTGALNSAA